MHGREIPLDYDLILDEESGIKCDFIRVNSFKLINLFE